MLSTYNHLGKLNIFFFFSSVIVLFSTACRENITESVLYNKNETTCVIEKEPETNYFDLHVYLLIFKIMAFSQNVIFSS